MPLKLIDTGLFLVNFCCSGFLIIYNLSFLCHARQVSLIESSLTSFFIMLLDAFHLQNSFQQAMWLS